MTERLRDVERRIRVVAQGYPKHWGLHQEMRECADALKVERERIEANYREITDEEETEAIVSDQGTMDAPPPQDWLADLKLRLAQWRSMPLDQIEPDDYPTLFTTMEAAIEGAEKERAMFTGRVPYVDRTLLLQNAHKLQALRAEVLAVAEEMERNECSIPSGHHKEDLVLDAQQIWAARLRKACE